MRAQVSAPNLAPKADDSTQEHINDNDQNVELCSDELGQSHKMEYESAFAGNRGESAIFHQSKGADHWEDFGDSSGMTSEDNSATDHTDSSDCDLSLESSDSDDNQSSSDSDQSDNTVESDASTSLAELTELQLQAFAVLTYINRHNLTAVAAADLIKLLRVICPTTFPLESSEVLLEHASRDMNHIHKEVHYCPECCYIFPEEQDKFVCGTDRCPGLRYKGLEEAQVKPTRKPRCFFVIADIASQITKLLQKSGIWEAVRSTKTHIQNTSDDANHGLSDICDGQCYRDLTSKGQFLDAANCNISFTFNTDGVPLFASTGCKLWPIFMVINELPPSMRMARENMILAGLWQGKGNPPFFAYMHALADSVSTLGQEGVCVKLPGTTDTFISKGIALLASVDLQAKAYIANITAHNGAYGCITCEEPGETVSQGKGHARHYPYRPTDCPLRTSKDIEHKATMASAQNRQKGIIGLSGLSDIPFFDIVKGLVPDYMHGVLLGVCKTLMRLWFSSVHSGKPFFPGKAY